MKTQVLARDSLQTNLGNRGNQMFTVLYDLMLYAIMPIAFEMSFVKIFQRSMYAYSNYDVEAISKLSVYFIIQWFLGVLVRKQYLRATLKRMTLALLILIQVKEAFFEEVFFDMLVSMVMESGFMVLLFFKFTNLVVILKMAGLAWVLMGSFLALQAHRRFIQDRLNGCYYISSANLGYFMQRIHTRINYYPWKRSYC